jgi:hypothetical protein
MKKYTINIDLEWDWNYIAILPTLALNLHMRSLDIEWFWLGIYITIKK